MQTLQYFNSDPTSYIHNAHTINNCFVKTADASIVSWLQDITPDLSVVILHNNLFHHATLWVPHTHLPTSLKYSCLNIISHYLPTSWTFNMQLSHATDFGEFISAHCYYFHIYQKYDGTILSPHKISLLKPAPDIPMDYFKCLDVYLEHHTHRKGLLLNEPSLDSAGYENHNPCIHNIFAVLDPSLALKLIQISKSNMILDSMFPSKNIVLTTNATVFWAGALVFLPKSLRRHGTPVVLPIQKFCACTVSLFHRST